MEWFIVTILMVILLIAEFLNVDTRIIAVGLWFCLSILFWAQFNRKLNK